VPMIDYEAEYNNRARVINSSEIIARWSRASATAREALPGDRDLSYGPGPRHIYDVYPAPGDKRGPLVVYIHGGYWQRGHGHDYAFVAREFLARGVSVVIPSYRLCPAATIADCVADMADLVAHLKARGLGHPVLVGHSAGGHIAASLMARNDELRAGCGISGVYDLQPLIGTSLNDVLRLDTAQAVALTPLNWQLARLRGTFIAAVGENESAEYQRQAAACARAWAGKDIVAKSVVIAHADHFTIVDELSKPGSPMLNRIVGMAEAVARAGRARA
jgi:arylformamidase